MQKMRFLATQVKRPTKTNGLKMRYFGIGILILIFSGCSHLPSSHPLGLKTKIDPRKPTIHLHLYKGYSIREEDFVRAFSQAGYRIKVRHNTLPMADESSFIVYGLAFHQEYLLVEIENILKKLGVSLLALYPWQNGKHSYTQGNVGVYLL